MEIFSLSIHLLMTDVPFEGPIPLSLIITYHGPALIESEVSSKEFRKNWARLIQKIYNINPILFHKYMVSIKIIYFIENYQLAKKILKHLDLWDVKRKPPARANGPQPKAVIIYDESSSPSADDYLIDTDYPIETYI